MEVFRMKFTDKLIEAIAGTAGAGIFFWIAFSFLEIGFTNFAHEWNAVKLFIEVVQ
jgi:hypothetical protein